MILKKVVKLKIMHSVFEVGIPNFPKCSNSFYFLYYSDFQIKFLRNKKLDFLNQGLNQYLVRPERVLDMESYRFCFFQLNIASLKKPKNC